MAVRVRLGGMAMKYYKKLEPKNQPVLADGTRLDFKTLDHLQGYYAIDSEHIHRELERLMREGRYGLTEISAEEFTSSYLEKKTEAPLRPLWREELAGKKVTGNSPLQTLGADAVAAAVAINPDRPHVPQPPIAAASPADAGAPNQPAKTEFKPPVGRRTPKVMPVKA